MAPQPANIGLLRAPRRGAAQWVLQGVGTKRASFASEIYCFSSRSREQALCGKTARRREAPQRELKLPDRSNHSLSNVTLGCGLTAMNNST